MTDKIDETPFQKTIRELKTVLDSCRENCAAYEQSRADEFVQRLINAGPSEAGKGEPPVRTDKPLDQSYGRDEPAPRTASSAPHREATPKPRG